MTCLVLFALVGCSQKGDESVAKQAGGKAGETPADFASGVGNGVDKQSIVQVEITKELTDLGITKTVAKATPHGRSHAPRGNALRRRCRFMPGPIYYPFPRSDEIARTPSPGRPAFSRRFRVIICFFQHYPCRIPRVFAVSRNRDSAAPRFLGENAVFLADFFPIDFERCGFSRFRSM
jgi:hypothetical protein